MGLFTDELAEGLLDIRQEYASEITFSRGTEDFDLTDIAEGKTNFRFVNSYGMSVRQETKDFLILASDLGYIEPRPGDVIRKENGTRCEVFEVSSINNEPCFRASDASRTTWRIHTLFRETK